MESPLFDLGMLILIGFTLSILLSPAIGFWPTMAICFFVGFFWRDIKGYFTSKT